ncbi:hypothetical protein DUNSADRAFT_6744 [Dunaliella salina]|uniref:Encoded protein n=1 Tax=Dunaliella salina TaxID=3046 RepID=A0ABQ7H6L0_DUNSA|nr:hypothetical protein DUNSADRAFT_6744 [Dunaliella salina]|eukprot:KAF5842500.1 hypothetical protein DUNSADRAFT_6744 [Dunaliella salina]
MLGTCKPGSEKCFFCGCVCVHENAMFEMRASCGMRVPLLLAFQVVFQLIIFRLQSRHKTIASRWGQDVRKHRYMYKVFKPMFLFR